MRRVVVLGTSGAGKSTLAASLAEAYGVPHVDLDELAGRDLGARVKEIIASPGWIVDGDYQRVVGDSVLTAADTAIWLDLPLRTSLSRMWTRTLRTRVLREPRLVGWVAHEVRSHLRRRLTMQRRLDRHGHLRLVHLRRSADVDAWLAHEIGTDL